MMNNTRRALAACVLLPAAAAGPAACARHAPPRAAPTPEARFAGCYALTHGPWSQRPAVAGPPTPFRLLAEVESVGPPASRRAVHPVRPGIARTLGIRALWSLGADDSVRVTWSTGFSGFQLRVTPAGRDTLRGIVAGFTDSRGSGGVDWGATRATALAVRTRCPASLR